MARATTEVTAESASLSIASQRFIAARGPILIRNRISGMAIASEIQRIIHPESCTREPMPASLCGRERGAQAAAPAADGAATVFPTATGALPCAETMNVL